MQASDLPSMIPDPEPWRREAVCRGVDPEVFVGEPREHKPHTVAAWQFHYAVALTYCARCPVTVECLAYALRIGEYIGVYGGTVPLERRRLSPGKLRTCRRCGGVFAPAPHQTLCSDACRARPAPKREALMTTTPFVECLCDRCGASENYDHPNPPHIMPLRWLQKVPCRDFFYGGAAVEAAILKNVSLVGQLFIQGSPFFKTEISSVDWTAVLLSFGGRYYSGGNSFEVSITEDPNTSGAPDFTMNFSFRRTF